MSEREEKVERIKGSKSSGGARVLDETEVERLQAIREERDEEDVSGEEDEP